jgi:hypothetical protein
MADAQLPWEPKQGEQWKDRINRAHERQKTQHAWWEASQQAYSPSLKDTKPNDYRDAISTKRIFTIVERKLAELFYQRPELTVAPSPLLLELGELGDTIAVTHGDILNEKLGPEGVNCKRLAQRANFDYLTCGAGWTIMGYRAYQKALPQQVPLHDPLTGEPVTEPVLDPMTGMPQMQPPQMDPATGMPALDPMTGMPVTQPVTRPVMETRVVPVTVKSECFWENISPKQTLIPAEWKSTDFDKAPWLGWKGEMALTEAKRLLNLPKDFTGAKSNASDGDQKFDHGDTPDTTPNTNTIQFTQVYYKSSVFREDVVHPDHLTELVFVDGIAKPVIHRDCPLQKFDERGRLTPDSLIGFPLHPLVIRAQTDAAYLMSDVAQWMPLEAELNKGREQMIKQRDANLLKFLYDTGKLGKDDIDKAVAAVQNGMIGLPSEAFADGKSPILPMERGSFPPENWQFNALLDADLARASAIDAAASGTTDQAGLTATEVNIRQSNVNVRLGWEQQFVADWFVAGATKYSAILQQFLPQEDAAAIVGTERAKAWEQFRGTVPARFAFTMTPDSSLRNDTPLERKQLMDVYTFLAKDPTINREYLNRQLLVRFRVDPSRAIIPADKRQKPEPEPAVPTIAVKDLEVFADPIVVAMVKANPQWKIVVPPEVELLARIVPPTPVLDEETGQPTGQTEHPGKVAALESLSKHQSDETGGQNGSGMMTPMMGGGAQVQ